ncbi:carbamoyltransferase HypF [Sessilibacter sp. MAH4]
MCSELVTSQRVEKYARIIVCGQVQGVGFRPFVYGLAQQFNIRGRVFNRGTDVIIEIACESNSFSDFIDQLKNRAPSLSRIDSISITENLAGSDALAITELKSFEIAVSESCENLSLNIVADAAPCSECLKELLDANNRRYLYPFINCTQCGPRFTIIKKLPYDRPNTTMASFQLCELCHQEYVDPNSRRFHAQPNACSQCGPKLVTIKKTEGFERFKTQESITRAFNLSNNVDDLSQLKTIVKSILAGEILAVKSVGGFHLICDANNPKAIETLRLRKNRPSKPLAIMCLNSVSARYWVDVDASDEQFLADKSAPILVLPLNNTDLKTASLLSPGLNHLGIMLPQSPLHWLLFATYLRYFQGLAEIDKNTDDYYSVEKLQETVCSLSLVMTSANLSGEPLITDNLEAIQKLDAIADVFVLHNRDIHTRCDDSVFVKRDNQFIPIRLARGFSPLKLDVKNSHLSSNKTKNTETVLALGSYLKNTVAINLGNEICVSQHVGDLDHPDNCKALVTACDRLLDIMQITPSVIACDLHPEGFGRAYALELAQKYQVPVVEVPHHVAHVHAVFSEFSENNPVLGLALDGYGFGWDETSRGGELLLIDGNHFYPQAELERIAQPGGDKASKEPWRMTLAWCYQTGLSIDTAHSLLQAYDVGQSPRPSASAVDLVWKMLSGNINCAPTTSAGRWFDAVAGLLGLCSAQSYEGEAAMLLEARALDYLRRNSSGDGNLSCVNNQFNEIVLNAIKSLRDKNTKINSGNVISLSHVLSDYVNDLLSLQKSNNLENYRDITGKIALDFHIQLSTRLFESIENTLSRLSKTYSNISKRVIFSGGCAQNQLLYSVLKQQLNTIDVELVLSNRIPVNDAGISVGQLHYALSLSSAEQVMNNQ